MGPISKSQAEHDALVRKLKADISEEVEQINALVKSVEENECELYYLYFKLTQLNANLTPSQAS